VADAKQIQTKGQAFCPFGFRARLEAYACYIAARVVVGSVDPREDFHIAAYKKQAPEDSHHRMLALSNRSLNQSTILRFNP
jgi:hypothetical protein